MKDSKKITKVIIPVAGSGTRFLPATKAQPKEMLAVIDKPVIQYLVEEAVAAGITDIIFITGRNKRAIEDHFDAMPELEAQLEAAGKTAVLEKVRAISKLARFSFVRQQSPRGDGDAILCAEHLIDENESVGVMFGDDIFVGTPRLTQIASAFAEFGEPVAALERVPKQEVTRYGVVGGTELHSNTFKLNQIIEKPKLEEAPSDMIFMGTYILTRGVFDELRALAGKEGELRIADALKAYLSKRPVYGVLAEGKRYDCGDKLGYIKTTVEFALSHPDVKNDFREYLKGVSGSL